MKIQGYAAKAKKVVFEPGKPIYRIGDPAAYIYCVVKGTVDFELHFAVEHIVVIPVEHNKYQKRVRTQIVKRITKHIAPGDLFGYEEIVQLRKTRITQARAVDKVELIYINRS